LVTSKTEQIKAWNFGEQKKRIFTAHNTFACVVAFRFLSVDQFS